MKIKVKVKTKMEVNMEVKFKIGFKLKFRFKVGWVDCSTRINTDSHKLAYNIQESYSSKCIYFIILYISIYLIYVILL